jgi:hypothetical protein
MNRLLPPAYDDDMALQQLAANAQVKSYPRLGRAHAVILEGYANYRNVCGNAFAVHPVRITKILAKNLKDHYQSPPNVLKHITELRASTEHLTCPMCGSLHRGTLDHLLPQKNFAAFAIFTLNLVPACKCNSKRKDVLTGKLEGERILHPYFDDCLSERLVAAKFEDLGPVPKVGLRLCVDHTHPEYVAIAFHFRSIVAKTAVRAYLRDKWIDLCRKPSLAVRALKENPTSPEDLLGILIEERELLDDSHRGKNNWNSMFVSGLIDKHVATWIFHRMNHHGRVADGPLV